MNLRLIPREIAARCIVEPLLAQGVAPTGNNTRRLVRWALANRDLRFPRHHPLKPIEEIDHWGNTFALSCSSLLWLWARLRRKQPSCILELSSGRTTFALATYARDCRERHLPAPEIITVEAETEWLNLTRETLERYGLSDFITFVHADAVDSTDDHGYALADSAFESLIPATGIEFLLIDGPAGGHGRGGTLRSVFHLLAPDAEIFLDDCDRPNEQATLRNWQTEYAGELIGRGVIPTVGGLGWLTRAGNKPTHQAR